ncbi:MAG: polysaccharide lyase family protein [Candidatus Hydrogenedens sp.]
MKKRLFLQILFVVFFLHFSIVAMGQDSGPVTTSPPKLLWEIGSPDNRCLELALAPTNYSKYREDSYFMVGHSNPAEDWCYIHPGPKDEWAQTIPHIFTVLFYLKSVETRENSQLNLFLLEFNRNYPPNLTVYVNGVNFPVRLPPGNGTDDFLNTFDGSVPSARRIEIPFPSSLLRLGENVIQFTVSGGSWFIYDAVQLFTPNKFELAEPQKTVLRIGKPIPIPLVKSVEDKEMREIKVPVRCYGQSFEGKMSITNNDPIDISLQPGWNTLYYKIKEVDKDTFSSIEIKKEDKTVATRDFVIPPAKPTILYLVPHSHNDIGYTHIQTDVLKIQQENIAKALDLIEKTKDYPPEAQFHWSAEVLWAVKSFWQLADKATKERFKKAVHEGYFELPALFSNQLTGLCNGEELTHLLDEAHYLSKELGTTIDSALITDVPGYTWGLIPVLAQAGVKYFSIGPNLSWRIGNILEVWGDKPFYWISPCGKHKVLTWIGFAGYSWFFGGTNAMPEQIRNYLAELGERNFPYDITIVRYSIASDNGPPDDKLPDFVKQWNEQHKTPKLAITTARKALKTFEEKYGQELPAYAGEITPYWEDGSASSARETALNRNTVRNLMKVETVWALFFPDKYPADKFQSAWENAILYDEHTWGAHNSISEPDSPFVKEQWAIKKSFADNAEKIQKDLLNLFINNFQPDYQKVSQIVVINPTPINLTQVITIPASWGRKGNRVLKEGVPIPSQTLQSNDLVFIANEIPAWGHAVFTITEEDPAPPENPVLVSDNMIQNGHIELLIDPKTGTIKSLKMQPDGNEFIKDDNHYKTNQYLYTEGRNPENTKQAENIQIEVKEKGPVMGSIVVHSPSVPGAKEIHCEYILYAGSKFVEIINSIDKEDIRTPEAVHYAFTFNINNPKYCYQTPFASIRLPEEQLPGSCKNYLTVQDWVDIQNDEKGITLFTPDTPMIEIGKITVDPITVGWKKGLILEPIIFSYVMNNYWETNYKASQDGWHTFRYYIKPYKKNDFSNPDTFAKHIISDLLVIPTNKTPKLPTPPIQITPNWVIYHVKYNPDEKAYIVRLFNPTSESVTVQVKNSSTTKPVKISSTLSLQVQSEPFTSCSLSPRELLTLKIK